MVDFPGKAHYDLDDLRQLVEVLRGEGGCPWDREQTHESLRRGLLEEAGELCEAIDEGSPPTCRKSWGTCCCRCCFTPALRPRRAGLPWTTWPTGSAANS